MNLSQQDYIFLSELFLILLALFFSDLILRKILSRSKAHNAPISKRLLTPLRVMLVILFLSFTVEFLERAFSIDPSSFSIDGWRNTGIILCSVWLFLRWKKAFYPTLVARLNKTNLSSDPLSLDIFGNIITILVLIVASFIILQTLGVDVIPLITFGGIGAAIVGFASKDTLANAFAGIMLYTTRPFYEGDLIELPEKSLTGSIEKIGWCMTTLRDLSKRPIYIPNTFFSNGYIVNVSRLTHRHIQETLRIAFTNADKVAEIVENIRSALKHDREIDQTQPIFVGLQTFGNYALHLEIRAYAVATDYEEFTVVRQKVLLKIAEIIAQSGAKIAHALEPFRL